MTEDYRRPTYCQLRTPVNPDCVGMAGIPEDVYCDLCHNSVNMFSRMAGWKHVKMQWDGKRTDCNICPEHKGFKIVFDEEKGYRLEESE